MPFPLASVLASSLAHTICFMGFLVCSLACCDTFVQVDALKAAEAAKRKEAAREADRQKQKEALKQQKLERAKHALQVKVGRCHSSVADPQHFYDLPFEGGGVIFQAKHGEAQRKAVEEARRREEAMKRKEEEAAHRRSASCQDDKTKPVKPWLFFCRHAKTVSQLFMHSMVRAGEPKRRLTRKTGKSGRKGWMMPRPRGSLKNRSRCCSEQDRESECTFLACKWSSILV